MVKRWKEISGREPLGKRPFGRPRRRWEDNIKVELGNIRVMMPGGR
jgi:hypothetical protein